MSRKSSKTTPEVIELAATSLDDHKATNLIVLDVRNLNDATDYFIIGSGTSDIHVKSIGQRLIEDLEKSGVSPHHIEGLSRGQWALIDYIDFVVHVFHPSLREFYQLERLWADAPEVAIADGDT